jgi:hypothetical protein
MVAGMNAGVLFPAPDGSLIHVRKRIVKDPHPDLPPQAGEGD